MTALKPPVAHTHRLHPSNSRRASDASVDRYLTAGSSRNTPTGTAPTSFPAHSANAYRDHRPPPSTRGFSSIPASANPPPLPTGSVPGLLPSPAFAWQPDSFPSTRTSRASSFARQSARGSVGSIDAVSAITQAEAPSRTTSEYSQAWEADSPVAMSAREPQSARAIPRAPRFQEIEGSDTDKRDLTTGRSSHVEPINVLPQRADSASDVGVMVPPAKSKGRKLVKKARK